MKRVLIITLLTCWVFGLLWYFVRSMGLAQQFDKRNLPLVNEAFSLVAHRGGSLERPENTMASFDHAAELDPRVWLEMDVRLSKDGELVIMHDEKVDRTTNRAGFVRTFTLAELKEMDAGYRFKTGEKDQYTNKRSPFPFRDDGIQIPTFEEVLKKHPASRKIIEIKDEDEMAVEKTVELVKKYNQQDKVILGSFNEKTLRSLRVKNQDWFYTTSANQVKRALILRAMGLLSVASFDGEFVMVPLRLKESPIDVFDEPLHKELKRQAREVFIWIINDKNEMNALIDRSVDGIITDRPSVLLNVLKERNL